MGQSRFLLKLLVGIMLALFFGVALYLRICLPYDLVFSGDWIKFMGNDADYHMRLVDNLLRNFPHFLAFDPYTFYPHGASVGWAPFFDWLLASIILIISLGSPTQHTIDVVGAYFPAVLGALTVIPVYFIGKELFNRWAGVIAAGLIALLPGEFLGRSVIGYTDHHVAETLFSTISILFLILAIKSARQRQLTLNHLKRRDWGTVTRPLVYSLLTGIFLGLYLLTWVGGLFFVFIISVYFVVQFIIDHIRSESTDYLVMVGTVSWLVALALSLPLLPQTWFRSLYLPSLLIAVLIPLVSSVISRLMTSKATKRTYYPLTLVGLGLVGLAFLYVVDPGLLGAMIRRFGIFLPRGSALTIHEVQPLFFPSGSFSFLVTWYNFTTGFFLSFIALGILIYLVVKQGGAERSLLIVWSLLALAATLGQRRFAYYLAVNVALLTGYLSWRILDFISLHRPATTPIVTTRKKKKRRESQKGGFHLTTRQVTLALGVVVVFFLTFYPNIKPAIAVAKGIPFAPSDGWCSSLSWLRQNTPEPFGDPDAYYELYPPLPEGESYKYPESAYGIMAWWDYGHWITRIGRRIPVSNPFQQGGSEAAQFFLAQDEPSANKVMDDLGAKYVMVDHETATTKFWAITSFAEVNPADYWDIYYQLLVGQLVPKQVFFPEYYRSLAVRLYNFNGAEVTPKSTIVISYQDRVGRDGKPYREIKSLKSFTNYEEATAYVSSQKSANYLIIGTDAFVSPVPLAALEHYKLIHSSEGKVTLPNVGALPAVKIFEYVE
jgi:dolichyl-diphosphooligosaccharide--protein glycosyltransferase